MRYPTGLMDLMEVPQRFIFNPKEGIDNPALIISDDTESAMQPRLCVMKRDQGEGFGFYLHMGRKCSGLAPGHRVGRVEPWSPADRSGLREGDHILEVNKEFVVTKDYMQVVRQIQTSGLQLCLMVLGESEYRTALTEGLDFRVMTRMHHGGSCCRPRLCHIVRDPLNGLGISIIQSEVGKNRYHVNVLPEGPAKKAGVCDGDSLLWLNGAMVSELTHSALAKMVKKCGSQLTVLVIDGECEKCFCHRKLPILPTMAKSHNLTHMPRTLHLTQGPQGFGFLLRQEKLLTGLIAHVLREVDPGSPAEAAGMEDGDIVLAVNGMPVEDAEHEAIVSRIRQSGQTVTLTVISLCGRDFYSKLGLCPLLFYDKDLPLIEEKCSLCSLSHREWSCDVEQTTLSSPRLCVLNKEDSSTFGFNLGSVQNEPGTFIVSEESCGARAGLWQGDVVLEVNGRNVEKNYIEEVVRLIRTSGTSLQLLVMERARYEELRHRATEICHKSQVSPTNALFM
ncbi:putative PDZ domain-containing protein PDZK1P1 isoform X2 [Denticeps clupeoides]|uniref:putative PDZ domain-containing protein PDZK1P1 isoform X2 n=1 Tax=Denticeps clupeoides TaxID=299321 RepID=UPI0010A578C7|nr:putative PDZ domain-containing protein PDZK1P1 isoform X2 [Denticeps clupeoides]